jgi:hypothetical protein
VELTWAEHPPPYKQGPIINTTTTMIKQGEPASISQQKKRSSSSRAKRNHPPVYTCSLGLPQIIIHRCTHAN